jgi:tetratricopeptide (TPR) repeat protein
MTGAAVLAALPLCSALSRADSPRDDYANTAFVAAMNAGWKHFYAREFKPAQDDFGRAAALVPDNTLAISFNGAAADQAETLDQLVNVAEDAVSGAPKNYVNHVRLGFYYLLQSQNQRPNRVQDARDEFTAALQLDSARAAAHVGMGILRFNERSMSRAKTELLAALAADPHDILAKEYLGLIYQTGLDDPEHALGYYIDIPNAVPQYADAWFHLGSVQYDLKQYPQSLVNLKKGIELDPGHVGDAGQYGYTLSARALMDMKRYDEAKAMLQASIDAKVEVYYAQALLAKIARDTAPADKDKKQ